MILRSKMFIIFSSDFIKKVKINCALTKYHKTFLKSTKNSCFEHVPDLRSGIASKMVFFAQNKLSMVILRERTCKILDLISLNKYVVTLIIQQANSCLTYNSLARNLPFIEKILLLRRPNESDTIDCRYNWSQPSLRELFFQKFVLSSIIRCLKI